MFIFLYSHAFFHVAGRRAHSIAFQMRCTFSQYNSLVINGDILFMGQLNEFSEILIRLKINKKENLCCTSHLKCDVQHKEISPLRKIPQRGWH